jgi:hypothetical protein
MLFIGAELAILGSAARRRDRQIEASTVRGLGVSKS